MPAPPPPPDVWQRLREGFAFPDMCQQKPQTRRWIRVYSRTPDAFVQELRRIAPELDFVASVLAVRGVPADFALLPWVESHFRAVESRGNRPAGIWQFMPATARDFGLPVRPDYDGRLDLHASTLAAASLLEHLGTAFEGDWRLANMAFNAGEFRVRRAIARRRDATTPVRVEDLALSPTTHEHLAKLEALGCLIRHADKHGIELPPLPDGARLRIVALPGPIDRDLARTMAGIDEASFTRLNPALRAPLLPAGRHLLLPDAALPRWQALVSTLPARHAAADWRNAPSPGSALAVVQDAAAQRTGIDRTWLAQLNTAVDGTVNSATPLVPMGAHTTAPESGPRYRVRSGDSAWTIARRFGVHVDALLRANSLGERSVLRPGQWLRIPR